MNAQDRAEVGEIVRAEIARIEARQRHSNTTRIIGFGDDDPIHAFREAKVRLPYIDFCYQPTHLIMSRDMRSDFTIVQVEIGRQPLLAAPVWCRLMRDLSWMPSCQVAIDHVWTVRNRSGRAQPFIGALRVTVEK